MRTRFLLIAALLVSLVTITRAQHTDAYYVYFTDGRVWGYPKDYVEALDNDGSVYTLTLKGDSVISWPVAQVQKVSEVAPSYPQFTEFVLDDKLNDQLYPDVEATLSANEVTASVSGIGKYLTPLYSMDMAGAVAYVDGKEQISGESRLSFSKEVTYTLGHPNFQRLSMEKISDEVWSEPETGVREIQLSAEMLSTNEPAASSEGFENLFDGVTSTIFHSRWESAGANIYQPAYITVALQHSISEFQFWYVGRTNEKYDIYEWTIEASHDGNDWEEITILDSRHGLPASNNAGYEFTSPVLEFGASYNYLRFTASRVGYKNYLCLAEFRLYEVTGVTSEPELLHPAQYAYQMVPMGREVPIRINWLTDQATSVPRIDINIDDDEMVSSKEYYLNALITFQGNGVWEEYDFQDSVKIKGRGNTSWSSDPNAKNPYRLKFEESVKPFGMKKGKNWNLIAQKQGGSLMTNPVAHKIARMIGLQTANDVIPVDLYINKSYRGSYFFTQKVGMANNSVDYEDESQAALFELDAYDEEGQFESYFYDLPVNIKAPEFGKDETLLDYYETRDEFNNFEIAVYHNNNYERFVDMDMLVRYMLVNDLVLNTELGHPKSAYLSRENMNHMASRYTFGPAWDFDWAYGYEGTNAYCVNGAKSDFFDYHENKAGNRFYYAILRSSEWVQYRYSQLWEEFMDKHLDELIDFVDEYYAYARSSFVNNSYMWGDGNNYDSNIANMKSWLRNRANYIKGSLTPTTSYAQEPFSYGDLNNDGVIDGWDVEYMFCYLVDNPWEPTDAYQADADDDGVVSLADLTWINLLLNDEEESQARSRQRRDVAWKNDDESTYDLDIDDMITLVPPYDDTKRAATRTTFASAELGLSVAQSSGKWNVEVSLTNSTPYIAFSMDFIIPEGFALLDVDALLPLSSRTANSSFTVRGGVIDYNVYRVIGYSRSSEAIEGYEGELFTLPLKGTSLLAPDMYEIGVENVTFVTENAYEETSDGTWITFNVEEDQVTQLYSPSLQDDVCWPADIYDAHGRLVRKQATSLQGLSRGVYIVNNRKVVKW